MVVLLIFDKSYKLISDEIYWTFELLEERINLKLKKLALVKCCIKEKIILNIIGIIGLIFIKTLIF